MMIKIIAQWQKSRSRSQSEDNNPHEVVMGFCFDIEMIIPQEFKYKTKVYKLKRFYPHDEKTEDFFFDFVKNSQYLQIVGRGIMSHQSNIHFNTCKEGWTWSSCGSTAWNMGGV